MRFSATYVLFVVCSLRHFNTFCCSRHHFIASISFCCSRHRHCYSSFHSFHFFLLPAPSPFFIHISLLPFLLLLAPLPFLIIISLLPSFHFFCCSPSPFLFIISLLPFLFVAHAITIVIHHFTTSISFFRSRHRHFCSLFHSSHFFLSLTPSPFLFIISFFSFLFVTHAITIFIHYFIASIFLLLRHHHFYSSFHCFHFFVAPPSPFLFIVSLLPFLLLLTPSPLLFIISFLPLFSFCCSRHHDFFLFIILFLPCLLVAHAITIFYAFAFSFNSTSGIFSARSWPIISTARLNSCSSASSWST